MKVLTALVVILFWGLGGLGTPTAAAADRPKIAAMNVTAQAGMTLLSAAIQGHIHSIRDVAKCLTAGAASGFGIYQSKVMVGKGHVAAGWITANLTGSLSENAAAGKHPLSRIGYSIGPMRVRVSVPGFDKSDAHVHLDFSAWETFMLVLASTDNDRVDFQSGLITFQRSSRYSIDNRAIVTGRAYGIFPGVAETDPGILNHELVHVIQELQFDLVEPSIPWFTFGPRASAAGGEKSLVRVEHFKLGMFNLSNNLFMASQAYQNRWPEIEAYRLAEDIAPLPLR